MHHRKVGFVIVAVVVAAALLSSLVPVATGQSFTTVVALLRGESARVTCDGANRLRVDRVNDRTVDLACGRAEAAPTPTTQPVEPTATATAQPADPTATATAMPSGAMIDTLWHPPMAHGDRPRHEHGDPPPAWVLSYLGVGEVAEAMLFEHAANTPGETMPYWKHTGFKGWETNFNGQACYGVFHLDFNPGGHVSRFHSYRLWCQDSTGAVSAISGWMDFGTGNNTGPNLLPSCGNDSGVRPIMNPTRPGCPIQFESWYARAGGSGDWAPDFGFNINPNYFAGGDPANPATWAATGGVRNLERRIEFAWYLGGSGIRPAPRGEFWATQWGELLGGPDAPICGTQRTIGDRSYTVLCLRQYIAPTLQPMTFPGNSEQVSFPGDGVTLPN